MKLCFDLFSPVHKELLVFANVVKCQILMPYLIINWNKIPIFNQLLQLMLFHKHCIIVLHLIFKLQTFLNFLSSEIFLFHFFERVLLLNKANHLSIWSVSNQSLHLLMVVYFFEINQEQIKNPLIFGLQVLVEDGLDLALGILARSQAIYFLN